MTTQTTRNFTSQEAKDFLRELGRHLNERWLKFKKINFGDDCVFVRIDHDDGSSMSYENALVLNHRGYWFILTEHLHYHYFHEEEVAIRTYKRIYSENSSSLQEYIDNDC